MIARDRTLRSSARRGRIDLVDILVGVVLAVLIPVLARVALGFVESGSPAETAGEELLEPPPTQEEVDARLQYISRLYYDNAYPFLERARSATGMKQFDELRWAKTALVSVRARLTDLEYLLRHTGAAGSFPAQREEIAALKQRVEDGLREIRELDVLETTE